MAPRRKPFRKGLEGFCGPYAVLNALTLLHPGSLSEERAEDLLADLLDTLAGGGMMAAVRDGIERMDLERMLPAASSWLENQGLGALSWNAAHPQPGETAQEFWERMNLALLGNKSAVIVGFGDDTKKPSRFEPHWTVVETVTPQTVDLFDSSWYGRVRRDETGVKPEPGWEIEDAYILRRAA